ncbi:hypothetical protein [Enterococcus bulliens]
MNVLFGEEVTLQPFDRILSGFDKVTEVAFSILDCSYLSTKYQDFGITGYRVGDFKGRAFIHRYVPCSFYQVPMLIYRSKYLIPLVFRKNFTMINLFTDPNRFASFLDVLDFEVEARPKQVIIEAQENAYPYAEETFYVIDTNYILFRLAEIIEVGALAIRHMTDIAEFMEWNRTVRLIDNGVKGRHSQIFDPQDDLQFSELDMIIGIVLRLYPESLCEQIVL